MQAAEATHARCLDDTAFPLYVRGEDIMAIMRRSSPSPFLPLIPLVFVAGQVFVRALTVQPGKAEEGAAALLVVLVAMFIIGMAVLLSLQAEKKERRRLLRTLARYGFDNAAIGAHRPTAELARLVRACEEWARRNPKLREVESEPEEALTTASLRQLLGSPGDGTPVARFNSEGGFSNN
jgi:hypothetical protein